MTQAWSELPSPGQRVLGVDPGLLCTGYAILAPAARPREARLVEAGVVRLPRNAPLPARLIELEDSLRTLIERHRPGTLACEELYAHYKHPRTAILMAHARGVILALAARLGLHVFSVAATNVKKLLTGSGHAPKLQVQRAVMATLNLPVLPEPHDVADAIAIALCGLRLQQAAHAADGPQSGSARQRGADASCAPARPADPNRDREGAPDPSPSGSKGPTVHRSPAPGERLRRVHA